MYPCVRDVGVFLIIPSCLHSAIFVGGCVIGTLRGLLIENPPQSPFTKGEDIIGGLLRRGSKKESLLCERRVGWISIKCE
jgi:hypothetical protein